MRVAILSTYPPRACGLATFANDLRTALLASDVVDQVDVVAVAPGTVHCASPEVVATVTKGARGDYSRAARLLNRLGVDVVVIEHEFGIFGGRDGEFVLSFAQELNMPYVTTLHTVLGEPSCGQASVLGRLCERAARVTVFTDTAERIARETGIADAGKVVVVPHGAPDELVAPVRWARDDGRFTLSTFGLLSAGKGLETGIEALAKVVQSRPDVHFVIAGRTHPEVVREEGERYRFQLMRLVQDLGVSDHVTFDDRFLAVKDLASLLANTDLYLTPYPNPEQIVSGALTFAVAAGCPVVSTPYRYAEDLLKTGAGVLVPFDDPAAMAEAIVWYIDHPDELAASRGLKPDGSAQH